MFCKYFIQEQKLAKRVLPHFIQDSTPFLYCYEFVVQKTMKTFSECNWSLMGLTFGHEVEYHHCWQMDVLAQNHHHHCNSCCLKVNYLYMDTGSFHCSNKTQKLILNSTPQNYISVLTLWLDTSVEITSIVHKFNPFTVWYLCDVQTRWGPIISQ